MTTTPRLSVKLKAPNGNKFEIIFHTDKYYILKELLEKHGFKDHEIINWKLKKVLFIL